MKPTSIFVTDLQGFREQLGTGLYRGIAPANVELTSDSGGPKQATFDLRRARSSPWPDIQPFAPVEVEVAGKQVWAGQIVEAPFSDESLTASVRCAGAQDHLDHDQYTRRNYVTTNMTRLQDVRSHLDATLASNSWAAGAKVETGGRPTMGWEKGQVATAYSAAGVYLDLGPDPSGWAKEVRVYMTQQNVSGSGNLYFIVRGSTTMAGQHVTGGSYGDFVSTVGPAGSAWYGGESGTAYRYVTFMLYYSGASDANPTGSDHVITLEKMLVASNTGYIVLNGSNYESRLTGTEVVTDAATTATTLLSDDLSNVKNTPDDYPPALSVLNPSADHSVSGWRAVGSTVERDTSVQENGLASIKWSSVGTADALYFKTKGMLRAGKTYAISFRMKLNADPGTPAITLSGINLSIADNTNWQTITATFTASVDARNPEFAFLAGTVPSQINFWGFTISTTAVDADFVPFYVPEFAPDGPRTPRQAIENVNPFYDYQAKVDAQRRLHFKPRNSTPKLALGTAGVKFNDASSASAQDLNNRVIVTGQDPAGSIVEVEVISPDLMALANNIFNSKVTGDLLQSYFPNPDFESDASGWTGQLASVTQDTTNFYAGTGSGKLDPTGSSEYFETTLAGDFIAGEVYRLHFWYRTSITAAYSTVISPTPFVQFGVSGAMGANETGDKGFLSHAWASAYGTFDTSWRKATVYWIPDANATSAKLRIQTPTLASGFMNFDGFTLARFGNNTPMDKRGFLKTHNLASGFTLTSSLANRLGEVYLAAHTITPFKGQGEASGPHALKDYVSGQPYGAEDLLNLTDEYLYFGDRIDPDTGNVGRYGRLVNVNYKPETDTATFDIDNTRGDFDKLLARVGVNVGQVRQ